MPKHAFQWILCALLILFVAGCGGTTSPGDDGSSGTTGGGQDDSGTTNTGGNSNNSGNDSEVSSSVAGVKLIAESTSMPSAATLLDAAPDEGVELTALVTNENNVLLDNAQVQFSAPSGTLVRRTATTAVLYTGGNPRNRSITVTAISGGHSDSIDIDVTGNSLSVTGPPVIQLNGAATFTVTLLDSAGIGIPRVPITVTSTQGNAIGMTATRTDDNGVLEFQVIGTIQGQDTITVSAGWGTATIDDDVTAQIGLVVDAATFTFTAPLNPGEKRVKLSEPVAVTVQWLDNNGAPKVGQTIHFSTTRGAFSGGDTNVVTDANGEATATLSSSAAGPATVTASTDTGLSASIQLQFIATKPDAIVVQAEPTTIAPGETSQITATVRDPNNNLVTGAVVEFLLQDLSGGSIEPAQATTGLDGQVSAVYTAGSTSAVPPAKIIARVRNKPRIKDKQLITIAGQALFITLGTGAELRDTGDLTKYVLPYTAIVTDAAGNPVPEAIFQLSITSVAYQEGEKVAVNGNWVPLYMHPLPSPPSNPDFEFVRGCPSEDDNNNGLLDAGEDVNGNNTLDPGNIATVPAPETVELNASGVAEFDITYPKNYSGWVRVRLRATATVEGSESTENAFFVLPMGAEDHEVGNGAPPGQKSPFGLDGDCETTYDPETGLEP